MRWIDSSETSFIHLESPMIILCVVFILLPFKGFDLLKTTVSSDVLGVEETHKV